MRSMCRARFVVLPAVLAWSLGLVPIAGAAGAPTYVGEWGSFGTGPLNFNGPTGIHVGPDGQVYVADNSNYRVKVFTNQGSFVREWLSSNGTVVDRPWDMAVGAGGVVYVTGTTHRVLEFTDQGSFLGSWGTYGSCDGEFWMPVGIDADAGGNLYISDYGNHRVQKFTADGTFITKWGAPAAACMPPNSEEVGSFQPVTICTDASGQVHVIALTTDFPGEFGRMEAQSYSNDGQLLDSWVLAANVIGTVEPFGIAVNAEGESFVADPMTHRVRWFDANGNSLGTIGSFGYGPGQFFDPRDVAIDAAGDLFVLDAGNNRVQKFTFATTDVLLPGDEMSLRAWPNPARGPVSVEFALARGGDCEVGVYDLSGRRVALVDRSVRPAGSHQVRWNGLNDEGHPVAPGLYLYRVHAGEQTRTGRIAVLSRGD